MIYKEENVFLTFLILTYKRPEKVKRLLEQFLDSSWKSMMYLNLEIIIADDYSCDNTMKSIELVLDELVKYGWKVKYILRDYNLRGDLNLFKGLIDDSTGEYTWFLCDDDYLDIQESISFIKNILLYKPIVAICGFKQGKLTKYSNNLGLDIRMSDSFEDAIKLISHYPKTSTYVFKRSVNGLTYEKFNKWNGTLYAWIGLAIYIIGINNINGVLVYPNTTVFADDDYGELRYSYRVFKNLNYVIRDSISLSNVIVDDKIYYLPYLQKDDEISLNILGLQAHYSKKTDIRYSKSILRTEIKFFQKNIFSIFFKTQRIILTSKLFFVFLQNSINKKSNLEF